MHFHHFHDYYQELHLILYDNLKGGESPAVPDIPSDRLIPLLRKDSVLLVDAIVPQARKECSGVTENSDHLSNGLRISERNDAQVFTQRKIKSAKWPTFH